MRLNHHLAAVLALLALAAPVAAKDSLGVFGDWGAFRDAEVPRCYAIAKPDRASRRQDFAPFASVGTWPDQQVRGQLHIRLSQRKGAVGIVTLRVGREEFTLTGNGADMWATNAGEDVAILAAMRSASRMTVRARNAGGIAFADSYSLDGVATALDAAAVGCARGS